MTFKSIGVSLTNLAALTDDLGARTREALRAAAAEAEEAIWGAACAAAAEYARNTGQSVINLIGALPGGASNGSGGNGGSGDGTPCENGGGGDGTPSASGGGNGGDSREHNGRSAKTSNGSEYGSDAEGGGSDGEAGSPQLGAEGALPDKPLPVRCAAAFTGLQAPPSTIRLC